MSTRIYTEEVLREAVPKCRSWNDLCRYFGKLSNGATWLLLKKRVTEYGIPTGHFVGHAWARGRQLIDHQVPSEKVLIQHIGRKNPPHGYQVRRSLVRAGVKYECALCGLGPSWNGKPLVLQIDHINGDRFDDRKENLRFLCPNCHTQTSNWGKQSMVAVA